jgi:hypothetical protein
VTKDYWKSLLWVRQWWLEFDGKVRERFGIRLEGRINKACWCAIHSVGLWGHTWPSPQGPHTQKYFLGWGLRMQPFSGFVYFYMHLAHNSPRGNKFFFFSRLLFCTILGATICVTFSEVVFQNKEFRIICWKGRVCVCVCVCVCVQEPFPIKWLWLFIYPSWMREIKQLAMWVRAQVSKKRSQF